MISRVTNQHGVLVGIAEVAREVTVAKLAAQESQSVNENLEERVRSRTAQLEDANRMLESFAYTVSHDLRAPLRTIRGLAQALLEDCGEMLDASGKDYINRILDGTGRMDSLIRDLLEYSRISRSRIQLEPVSLSRAVAAAVEQHTAVTGGDKPDVRVIEPLADVIGHEGTVVQMLMNLIGNAAKFVDPGVRPVIQISTEVNGDRVRVWVEDNGIGIAPQHHARIFEVFERLHGISDYPGTGVGLAIVRKGALRLGGDAGVESALGAGSRFWFELQAAAGELTA